MTDTTKPGPYPTDTTSPEALAQPARNADYEARLIESERILAERWGGSLAARDAALEESASIERRMYATDADHAAAVNAHMDKCSAVALALARGGRGGTK